MAAKRKWKLDVNALMPIYILAFILIVFALLTRGKLLAADNLSNIVNQSIPYFICGLGMLFVAAIGGPDITCGSLIGLAGALAGMAVTKISFLLLFPVAILVGLAVGLLNGLIVCKLKVPSFMVTLSMLIALRACVNWLLQTSNIICTRQMLVFNQSVVKIPFVIALLAVFGYIFRFTPFGTYLRAIGENEQAFTYTGISLHKIKIAAYMISGMMAGIAGIFVMVRNGGSSNTMGSSMEMKVMLCLFLASIPVQGGSGTRLYKMIVGVLTYFVLDNGLTLMGGSTIVNQLIRGIVLILALTLTRIVSEQKLKRDARLAEEAEEVMV